MALVIAGEEKDVTEATRSSLPKRLPTLTSIRFIAAIWVVLYHYRRELAGMPKGFLALIDLGAVGVSLFFVLSGFILTHTYWERDVRSTQGLRDFFVHRFARIYPMYLFSLLIVTPRLFIEPNNGDVMFFFNHPWYVGLAHVFALQVWLYRSIGLLNGPAWTISCEAGFYVLFPSLILWVRKIPVRRILFLLPVVFLASAILPILYAQQVFSKIAEAIGAPYAFNTDLRINQAIRMWPTFRLGEFLIGMLLAALVQRRPVWGFSARAGVWLVGGLGVLLLVWSAGRITPATVLFVQQVAPVPLFAAVILGLALARGERPAFLRARVPLLLGEASYSLYLLHVPLKHAFEIVAGRLGIRVNAPWEWGFIMLLTLLAAIGAFWTIETPVRRLIVARFASKRKAPLKEPQPSPL